MKKILFHSAIIGLVGLGAVSCSLKEVAEAPVQRTVTLEASLEGNPTKSGVIDGEGGGKNVVWSSGDKISLFFGSGNYGGNCFTTEDSGQKAKFTGAITSVSGAIDESFGTTLYWGVYPFAGDNSCDGTSVTAYLEPVQKGVPDTFADNTAITVGRSVNLSMTFKNTNTIFAFKVVNDNISRVTLRGNNGEKISGQYTVTFDPDGNVVTTPSEAAMTSVAVKPAEGMYFIPDTWYYIVALPAVFSQGYTLTFENVTEYAEYVVNESRDFKVSTFYTLTDKDSGMTLQTKPGNVNIPDPVFKAYCVEYFDTDEDGEISYEEAAAVNSMYFDSYGIYSLEGIEAFPNLMYLNCTCLDCFSYSIEDGVFHFYDDEDNEVVPTLGYIDLTNNTSLTNLVCSCNVISDLDLSGCPNLKVLRADYNRLTTLDLTACPALTSVNCTGNRLTSLDLSKCADLESLVCCMNRIVNLDVRGNTSLNSLDCSMMTDPFTHETTLEYVRISREQSIYGITSERSEYYIPKETVLYYDDEDPEVTLNIPDTNFKNYCVGNFDRNGDGEISVWEVSFVNAIYPQSLEIESFEGVEGFPHLQIFQIDNNPVSEVDLSKIPGLTVFSAFGTGISSIDVSKNPYLKVLGCSYTKVKAIDVSHNPDLETLQCADLGLASLDVTHNPALKLLDCNNNGLTVLDISKNTRLSSLNCSDNLLTGLNLSNCENLQSLDCRNDMIDLLDLRVCYKLSRLWCSPMNDGAGANVLGFVCLNDELIQNGLSYNITPGSIPAQTNLIFGHLPEEIVNIPDANFKSYLVNNFDTTGDGKISYAEAVAVTSIDVSEMGISSLQGIEAFTSLTGLDCADNALTSLNVRRNYNLEVLDCSSNAISSLEVLYNSKLRNLSCGGNLITRLDLSTNLALSALRCAPMNNIDGDNVLESITLRSDADIDYITKNRSPMYIPAETQIYYQTYNL